MIVTEIKPIREIDFVHTYSDAGMKIRQDGTGNLYDDALDPVGANRTYTETDIPIDEDYDEVINDILAEVKEND